MFVQYLQLEISDPSKAVSIRFSVAIIAGFLCRISVFSMYRGEKAYSLDLDRAKISILFSNHELHSIILSSKPFQIWHDVPKKMFFYLNDIYILLILKCDLLLFVLFRTKQSNMLYQLSKPVNNS